MRGPPLRRKMNFWQENADCGETNVVTIQPFVINVQHAT